MQLNDTTTLIGIKQDMYFNAGFNANTYAQNDLNRIINKYYKMVQEDIRAVNEDFFLVSTKSDIATPTTAPLVFTYPSDYEKLKSFWVAATPVSVSAPLATEYARCTVIDTNKITDPTYAFTNPTVVAFGSYFVLYPILTNTQVITGGMKLYYIPTQIDLANDTDVPNVFPDYHDVITAGALIDIARRMGNQVLLKDAQTTFKNRRAEMKSDAGGRILDVQPAYVEGQGSSGGWSFPFGKTGI
jgi:hypothetical protein